MYERIGGKRIYFETRGEGRGILCLHGFPVDHRCLSGAMEPFFAERKGYRRIYLDLPGMGLSESSGDIGCADDMMERVRELAGRIIPGENYLVAGYSYGGYLARGMVNKYAEEIDGLFLLCPVAIPDRRLRELPPHRVFYRDEEFLGRLSPGEAEEFGKNLVIQTGETWRRYGEEIAEALAMGDRDFIRRYLREGYRFTFPVEEGLPFGKPTLILAGRQDSVVGYRDIWKVLEHYPRGTFAVLDRAGHNLQMEQESLFSLFLSDWLDRVEMEI